MISLYIDTSTKYLCVGIAKDYQIIYKKQEIAFQKQSELCIPLIKEAFAEVNINLNDVNEICVTIGPGSFTGIRIGMCIAKVLSSLKHIPLKAMTSLNAYANEGKKIVILDAKANRAYVGVYNNNQKVIDECVMEIEKFKEMLNDYKDYDVVFDTYLINQESEEIDIIENMNRIAQKSEIVQDVNGLVPVYLKDR